MPNYIKLIDSLYNSIFKNKSNNKYIQPLVAAKEVISKKFPYLVPSLYYHINYAFQRTVPYTNFLSQQEREEEFKDFCIKSLNDRRDSSNDIPATLLSMLHHDNGIKCSECGNIIDKQYISTNNGWGGKQTLCIFCISSAMLYYKCEKCGAYGSTMKDFKRLKFYPEVRIALSKNGKETYNGINVSELQKLGIVGGIKIYEHSPNIKYLLLYPTLQSLNTPEMAAVTGNKRVLSTIKKCWGLTLCDSCQDKCNYCDNDSNIIIRAIHFGRNMSIPYPISHPVEYVKDYIDFEPTQNKVRDMLVTEIENNPELIYLLLKQPKYTTSAKDILEILIESIVKKFSTNKKSDSIIKEIIANKKKGEAILIIPQELLTEDNVEKIQDTLDRQINYVYRKVDCKINREVSFEDDALTITLAIF